MRVQPSPLTLLTRYRTKFREVLGEAVQMDALRQRRASGEAITSLRRAYGLSKTSVYRYLAQVLTVGAEAAD